MQHDTPEMQYKQILLEAQSLIHKIKRTEIDIRIAEIEIGKLRANDDEVDNLEAEKKELDLWLTKRTLIAAKEELSYLEVLAAEYPPYTPEDLENNQEVYWNKRLRRQAELDQQSSETGIGVGNLDSLNKLEGRVKEIEV